MHMIPNIKLMTKISDTPTINGSLLNNIFQSSTNNMFSNIQRKTVNMTTNHDNTVLTQNVQNIFGNVSFSILSIAAKQR